MSHTQRHRILVMGVSGCGKSSIAQAVAHAIGADFVEGDSHHPTSNQKKMRQGIALDDADRQPWLERLGQLLQGSKGDAVLACSALKRKYRDQLRSHVPDLKIVFIEIGEALAAERVSSRTEHLFPASLVTSQFAALQPPVSENNVLVLTAENPLHAQVSSVTQWLGTFTTATSTTRMKE